MKKIGLILLLTVVPIDVLGRQVSVVASVDETTVGTEEIVTYTIQVSGAASSAIRTPVPPSAQGLSLLQSSPSTQSNISIVNGVMEQSFGFSWAYRPLGEGSARLASTTVTVGQESFTTDAIDITVVPQSQRPARPSGRSLDPFSSLFRSPFDEEEPSEEAPPDAGDLFIRAIPSARRVVQNEQVTIEYQLFFREGIQLRQSRLTDSWDAEGFWREELDVETRPIPQIVVENGLRYNKIVLKRAAVFPTRAGNLVVDSLRIESEAVLPSRSGDPFQQLFSLRNRYRPVELASPAITITSEALPPNAPDSFTGAVGRYEFDVQVDRTAVEVGESIQVVATVSGTGNLATLDAPDFLPPASFELYEPEVETNLNRSGQSLRGNKRFTFVMVARSNGTFVLPSIEFSYFDTSTDDYRVVTSRPIEVLVTGSAASTEAVVATTNGLPVDDVAQPLEDPGHWVRTDARPLHTHAWPYAALLIPLIALAAAAVHRRHSDRLASDVGYARSRQAHPLAKKQLKLAGALLEEGDTVSFFGEIERALLGFLGNRLNISEKGLTRTQLDGELARAGIEARIRQRVRDLLEVCDRGRFAPGSFDRPDLDGAYDEAAGLIVAVAGVIENRKRSKR